MFEKILIANRGEIALRVIRACKELGVRTLAVYSEADVDSLHVQLADEAICIGPAQSSESYLKIDRIMSAAEVGRRGCDSPGLRISLRERALRGGLRKLQDQVHRTAGERDARDGRQELRARSARKAGVSVTPGQRRHRRYEGGSAEGGEEDRLPVMIKAVAGGGGRGMRASHNEANLPTAFHAAKTEAEKAFGNGDVYIEKLIVNPHHIEFQIIADSHGKTVHLGERDCSIQRRNQKVIEECPSPLLDDALRKKMGKAAVKLAEAVGYVNAGTMEFLVDNEGHYYFIEMNTRIQVEHTITEEVYGCDLVKEQIKIAAGHHLSPHVANATPRSHAIQCRINAEDPEKNFQPRRANRFLLRTGRPWRADRLARLHRLRRAAVLRLDDRQADHRGRHTRLVHRPHAARAGRVLRHRDQDDRAVPQRDHAQRGLPQRQLRHRLRRTRHELGHIRAQADDDAAARVAPAF
jgi:acetyl-CoA carboxylase biotin carboxylase subunit